MSTYVSHKVILHQQLDDASYQYMVLVKTTQREFMCKFLGAHDHDVKNHVENIISIHNMFGWTDPDTSNINFQDIVDITKQFECRIIDLKKRLNAADKKLDGLRGNCKQISRKYKKYKAKYKRAGSRQIRLRHGRA